MLILSTFLIVGLKQSRYLEDWAAIDFKDNVVRPADVLVIWMSAADDTSKFCFVQKIKLVKEIKHSLVSKDVASPMHIKGSYKFDDRIELIIVQLSA